MDRRQKTSTWAITDGRAGIANQALGLAEAIGFPVVAKTVHPRLPWTVLPVTALALTFRLTGTRQHRLEPPWPRSPSAAAGAPSPTFWRSSAPRPGGHSPSSCNTRASTRSTSISSCRPSTTDSRRQRRTDRRQPKQRHARKTRTRGGAMGDAVFGASQTARRRADRRGKSNRTASRTTTHASLAAQLKALAAQDIAVMATTSRRTGETQAQIIRDALAGTNAYVWDGRGDNPYFGLLAFADAILVTSEFDEHGGRSGGDGKAGLHCRYPRRRCEIRPPSCDLKEPWNHPPLHRRDRALDLRAARTKRRVLP